MTAFRGPGVRQIGAVGTTPKEHRLALAGQYAENAPGVPRSGLLAQGATNVVTPTADTGTLTYSVAPLAAVISRTAGDGVYTPTTAGATTVPTGAAPASGSRWDLIWIKQSDSEKGDLWPISGGVADNDARLGVTQGTASATPARPTGSVPHGALVIAEARIFSGTLSTTASPNTMTQIAPITAARGAVIPVRTATDLATITGPYIGQTVTQLDIPSAPLMVCTGVAPVEWVALQETISVPSSDANWFTAIRLTKSVSGTATLITATLYFFRQSGTNFSILATAWQQLMTPVIPSGWRPPSAAQPTIVGTLDGGGFGAIHVRVRSSGAIDVRSAGGTTPVAVGTYLAASLSWTI